MLDLPTVTLFIADCVDAQRAAVVVDKCKAICNFGAVKLLTSLPTDHPDAIQIPPLRSHVAYSVFMLKRAVRYVDTQHFLVVQHDGWILNPDAWCPGWLDCDYIGPLFIHRHHITDRSVGSGGFSLRSRALMAWVDSKTPPLKDDSEEAVQLVQRQVAAYEDGVISMNLRRQAEAAGFCYASPMEAAAFAQGGQNDPTYHVSRPFGFHGLWPNVDRVTGIVAPPPFH